MQCISVWRALPATSASKIFAVWSEAGLGTLDFQELNLKKGDFVAWLPWNENPTEGHAKSQCKAVFI